MTETSGLESNTCSSFVNSNRILISFRVVIFLPKRLHFPGPLAARCSHVTKVWLMNCKWKCSEALLGKLLKGS